MILFIFLIGLCIGSFLNVCIIRLPKNLSLAKPGSSCPSCSTLIKWYDNIPLISFFMLGRVCRQCKAKISWQYPIIEILTAAIWVLMYVKFGMTTEFFQYGFFFCLLILISAIDLKYYAIPAYLCLLGIVVGLGFSLSASLYLIRSNIFDLTALPIVQSIKGLIFGFGLAYLFKFFGDFFVTVLLWLRKKDSIEGETESLGLGDVDFLGLAGVFMGVKACLLIFFLAPIIALGYAVFALLFKRSHLIPYLPYLSVAALVTFYFGDTILKLFF